MKRLICLLFAALLLCSAAPAEEAAFGPLPMDLTPGHVAAEDKYTEDGYQDESLTVQMSHVIFDDTTTIHVARVKIADPTQLRTAVTPKGKTNKVSTLARQNNAVVAIGGEYFSNEKGGYVLRMGQVQDNRKKPRNSRDMLCVDAAGNFHILIRSAANKEFANQLKALTEAEAPLVNVFNFGPALVIDGQMQEIPKKYSYNPGGREPRCAIGQLGELEYLLVVVDSNKRDGKGGLSMGKLAQFMLEQGCVQAYNLDGGNSALMVFHDKNYSNKSFEAERAVSDIIYIATAVDYGLDGTK